MLRTLGLAGCLWILISASSYFDNVMAQELVHFNKSSGVDFEKDNVWAEIMPTSKPTPTKAGAAGQENSTDVEVSANKKESQKQTMSWKTVAVGKIVDVGSASSTEKQETAKTTKKPDVFAEITMDLGDNTPPFIRSPVSSNRKIIPTGNYETMQCVADGVSPLYKWYRNNIEIDTTGVYVKAFENGTLNFLDYTSRENGDYRCTAENAFGKALSPTVPVVGAVEPRSSVANATRHKTVKKWLKANLECGEVPETIPQYLKRWYVGSSREVTLNYRVGLDSQGTLRFAYTELSDAANPYVCGLAAPNYKISRSINFFNPLKFEVEDASDTGDSAVNREFVTQNAKAVLGQPFLFECYFSGKPAPSITWKNISNDDIRKGDPRYEILDFGRQLKIRAVRQEDEGTFKCTATNTVSSMEVPLSLNVTSPPLRTSGSLSTYTQPDKTDFTLTCKATAAFREHLDAPKWYRNGERLLEGNLPDPSRYHFSQDHTELAVTDLDKAVDTASYQCSVANSEGELFMNGYLRVINSIEITQRPPDVLKVSFNSTGYDITVLARGDNCCQINSLYYFNDTQLSNAQLQKPPFQKNIEDGSLMFVPTSVTKEELERWLGGYRCRMSNLHQDVDVYFRIGYSDDALPIVAKQSSLGLWWIGLLCGILAIVIVIIIVIIIYKSNYPGDTYQLEKTELKHDLNPEKDLLDQSFQEI